jgi:PAS domain S-box-containing protein
MKNAPPGSGPSVDLPVLTPKVLEGFFNLSLDLLCLADTRGNFLRVNPEWEKVLGYSMEELNGRSFLDFVHPEDLPATLDAMKDLDEGKNVLNFENRYRRHDGEFRWIEWRSNIHGGIIYAAARDITAGKMQLAEFERLSRLFEQTSRVARVGGWEADLLTNDIWWSDVTRQIHECAEDYRPSFEDGIAFYLEGEDREIIRREFAKAVEEGTPFDLELRILTARKRVCWIRTVGQPVFSGEKCVRVIGAFQDIDEKKKLEDTLREAASKAEEANRAKSAFLATMSHEIRTPLNGVIGGTELLRTTSLSGEQESYVQMILRSGDLLLSTINDVLDYSKIESGRIDIESAPFDLLEMVESLIDAVTPLVRQKGIELVFLPAPGVPRKVVGDAVRLRQVLLNLLSNAIKFTQKGYVEIGISGSPDDVLSFHVEDTGIGIPAERMAEIFLPFVQAESSTTRQFGGTGLGLSISHRLVALMGGELDVSSSAGHGTRFSFSLRLPVDSNNVAAEVWNRESVITGRRVLLLENSEISQKLLRHTFEAVQARVVLLGSWEEVLTTKEDLSAFDLVITDRFLGETDMAAQAGELRKRLGPKTKVLLLGNDTHGLGEGPWDTILEKPIKMSQLLQRCRKLLAGESARSPSSAARTTRRLIPESRKSKVLVVEDNRLNQIIARTMLGHLGVREIAMANNGREALEALATFAPDLILMDCQMPIMDGYEATRLIRQGEADAGAGAHIPIVGLSAAAVHGDREKAIQAGMDHYLTKPLRPGELQKVWADLSAG